MADQLQLRRGTTAEHSTFTGVEGEVTVDTVLNTTVVHDGTTQGGHPTLNAASIPAIKSGRKNYIINGNLNTTVVNQRGLANTSLSVGVYGFDRWKGESPGFNEQVVVNTESINADFTVSFLGGGTATVNGDSGLSSGDTTTLVATGNFSVIVPEGASYVQLEEGGVATDFEYRTFSEELALCQAYYLDLTESTNTPIGYGFRQAADSLRATVNTPVTMRALPTAIATGTLQIAGEGLSIPVTSLAAVRQSNHGIVLGGTATGIAVGSYVLFAEGGITALDAEL